MSQKTEKKRLSGVVIIADLDSLDSDEVRRLEDDLGAVVILKKLGRSVEVRYAP